jgi:hypothetical protein
VALEELYRRLGEVRVVADQDQGYLPVVTLDSRLHMRVRWGERPDT